MNFQFPVKISTAFSPILFLECVLTLSKTNPGVVFNMTLALIVDRRLVYHWKRFCAQTICTARNFEMSLEKKKS